MRLLLLMSLVYCGLFSCKSQQFTPYDFEGRQIIFGQGGGFSGQVTEYTLLENGQLFAGTNKEGFVDELKSVDKKVVKQIFSSSSDNGYDTISFDKPGNQYFYINFKKGDHTNLVQWAPGEQGISKELKIFFGNLKNITQRITLDKK